MKNRFVLLLTAAGLSSSAIASDLLDTYRMALDSDPGYRSSIYLRQATAKQPDIARSALRPSVSLSANGDLIREDMNAGGINSGSDEYSSLGAGISLNQALYDRQSSIAVDQAELADQRAGTDLSSSEDDLIIRVATSYFAVLGAIDNLELATSEKIAIKRQLELADERLNVGIGTQTDLYDARARFQLAEAREIQARNLIEDARQSLIAIVGGDPGELDRLRDDTPLEMPDPQSEADWVALAKANNPDLKSALIDLEIARQEVERLKYARHPSVFLNAGHNYNDTSGSANNGSGDRNKTQIGVGLDWPLYLGGSVEALVQQAGLNANAQESQTELTRRQIERNVRDVYNNVTSGIKLVEAFDQAVIASESAVEAKEEGYAAGLITNLDVLDAQRDLYQAQLDYLRARYDYILSVLRLEQASGLLDETDVARVNSWLR
ncbi:MAG: outer membrane protein TolC [marine bacterium B5-7]|nr:MAG: outer membrane protein TolC [marine bacterium B5-7]